MTKSRKYIAVISLAVLLIAADSDAGDLGFFRTVPAETPDRGILRMSSTSFYSDIMTNQVLAQKYGVKNPRIFSSISEFEIGITNSLALNGSIPYYADIFTQGSKSSKKTGAGDVVLGFRLSRKMEDAILRGLSFGSRVRIPEQLGYGPEPLGFRTFSYGKIAYSIEASTGFRFRVMDFNLSVNMLQFPKATKADSVFTTDTFYDTGLGYMGVGRPDKTGFAPGIFQDQLNISFGMAVPLKSWFSGLLEFNSTSFIEKPKRENIITLAPGFRFGKADGFNFSAGINYALRGSITDKTFMVRFRIPTLSARAIKQLLVKKRIGREVRSRNSLVAVDKFSKYDITYLYEEDLKATLENNLNKKGFLDIVPAEKVERILQQKTLVPLAEKPQQLGVRLGANYFIHAEILEFKVDRSPSFSVPFLIRFPQTSFSLSANASVTNLITGDTHQLGIISANVAKPRGVNFFPGGASSDIIYISEPEKRIIEKKLIDRWVEEFNTVLMDNIEIFGWEPKQTELNGITETYGG